MPSLSEPTEESNPADHLSFDFWSPVLWGFPDSSVGEVSACNAGDPGSIPVLGRSAGEGIGYPLQYSWASPMAQLVENSHAMWETWVWSLGWEEPLEKGKDTHSSILAWRISWTVLSMKSQRVGHDSATFSFTCTMREYTYAVSSYSVYDNLL